MVCQAHLAEGDDGTIRGAAGRRVLVRAGRLGVLPGTGLRRRGPRRSRPTGRSASRSRSPTAARGRQTPSIPSPPAAGPSSLTRGWGSSWPTARDSAATRRSRASRRGRSTKRTPSIPGKRSRVVNHARRRSSRSASSAAPARRWEVVLRAYDDGAAFRYRFPAQEGWKELAIAGERTRFRLPDDAMAYALPLNGFTTATRPDTRRGPSPRFPRDWLLGLPLLAELPGTGWLAVTEATSPTTRGCTWRDADEGGAVLAARLSPRPGRAGRRRPGGPAARVALAGLHDRRQGGAAGRVGPGAQPQRPVRLADTSWIRPGKTTFPWWNGFYEEKGSPSRWG